VEDQFDGAVIVMRGAARAAVAVVLALSAVSLQAPQSAAAAGPATCAAAGGRASTDPGKDQSAGRRPVVLVHGWNGAPLSDMAKKLAGQLSGRITTYTFDYSHWAAYWASDRHIAPCLADYLNAVSRKFVAAGGDGKIIVVAHSMGGLAIRYAMDPASVADPVPATVVPYIVTLGTPQLGSPWGGTPNYGRVAEVWKRLQGNALPPSSGQDGGKCLASHKNGAPLPDGCGPLPPWLPKGVTLTEIAGDATVDRSFFGIHAYSIPLFSDGIVPAPSAWGYPASGPGGHGPLDGAHLQSRTDSCHVDFDKLHSATAGLSFAPAALAFDYVTLQDLQNDKVSLAVQTYLAGAFLTASCSHSRLPTDQSSVNQTTEAIKSALSVLGTATPRTTVVDVAPWTAHGLDSRYRATTVAGYCWTTSTVSYRADAYRCVTGHLLYDPCFPDTRFGDTGSVACITAPAKAVVMNLTQPLPDPPGGAEAANPFMIVLESGEQCSGFSGAGPQPIDNLPVTMSCTRGTMIWGEPVAGSVWTAKTSTSETGPLRTARVRAVYR
jgi:pimeloyl-ACP methyl ester carboxylesterase